MTMGNVVQGQVVRHGTVWLAVLALLSLVDDSQVLNMHFREPWLQVVCMAWPIYAHFWLLQRFFSRRLYAAYGLLTAAVVTLAAGLFTAAEHEVGLIVMSPLMGPFGQNCLNVILLLLLSLAARYLRRGIVAHYQMRQLRAQQLDTELRLLKSQVNQHFLFNTLNNLYGLSLAAPDQLPEALLKLADLMRYQLDGSRQAHTTVGGEADYLASYIGLEKLRLRSNTQVEFTADVPRPEQPLAPLLLLPLVENCFKHAVAPSGQNTICIQLVQTDAGLTLRTTNSIPPHFRPAPSGLGLPTLRARLAQLYPGPHHRLTIEATPSHYAATLMLCP